MSVVANFVLHFLLRVLSDPQIQAHAQRIASHIAKEVVGHLHNRVLEHLKEHNKAI